MDSPLVQAGGAGYVSVQAIPDRLFEGKVTRTSWVLGANRTLNTELDLPNPDGLLRPGMYATAAHPAPGASQCLRASFLCDRSRGQASVLLGGQGRPSGTDAITLGLQVGNDVEVTSGLKGDELVVQSQTASLQEGQPVELTK